MMPPFERIEDIDPSREGAQQPRSPPRNLPEEPLDPTEGTDFKIGEQKAKVKKNNFLLQLLTFSLPLGTLAQNSCG
jgi:hypothetical protein